MSTELNLGVRVNAVVLIDTTDVQNSTQLHTINGLMYYMFNGDGLVFVRRRFNTTRVRHLHSMMKSRF